MPEFVAGQDGAGKQDRARNAVARWFRQHREPLRPLRPVYPGDDRFAGRPIATMVNDGGGDFRVAAKESSPKARHDFIRGAEASRHAVKVKRRRAAGTLGYRWIEDAARRGGRELQRRDAMPAAWRGVEILDAKGRVEHAMAWVASLPVSKANAAAIAACGRARWKIANESFNARQNRGHERAPNSGHGARFLAMAMAMAMAALNLLAFAWHTALDRVEPPWPAVREAAG